MKCLHVYYVNNKQCLLYPNKWDPLHIIVFRSCKLTHAKITKRIDYNTELTENESFLSSIRNSSGHAAFQLIAYNPSSHLTYSFSSTGRKSCVYTSACKNVATSCKLPIVALIPTIWILAVNITEENWVSRRKQYSGIHFCSPVQNQGGWDGWSRHRTTSPITIQRQITWP